MKSYWIEINQYNETHPAVITAAVATSFEAPSQYCLI